MQKRSILMRVATLVAFATVAAWAVDVTGKWSGQMERPQWGNGIDGQLSAERNEADRNHGRSGRRAHANSRWKSGGQQNRVRGSRQRHEDRARRNRQGRRNYAADQDGRRSGRRPRPHQVEASEIGAAGIREPFTRINVHHACARISLTPYEMCHFGLFPTRILRPRPGGGRYIGHVDCEDREPDDGGSRICV